MVAERACMMRSSESFCRIGRRWQQRDALFAHHRPIRRRRPTGGLSEGLPEASQPRHGNGRLDRDELTMLP
jgi:hypothetical protein